ncbi:MAG: hypothetical protein MRY21_07170 [Simkaniaceae bacterium]|nr:hypothetical protein [Simkaniaceae bacterium]
MRGLTAMSSVVFNQVYHDNLDALYEGSKKACNCSRFTVYERGDGRIHAKSKYHFLQIIQWVFSQIISCLFPKSYRSANKHTIDWFYKTFGENRIHRISSQVGLDIRHKRENGLFISKNDVRTLMAGIMSVTELDIKGIFKGLKGEDQEESQLLERNLETNSLAELRERFRNKSFTQLSQDDIDVLYAIANPIQAMGQEGIRKAMLGSMPKYAHPGYDRGRTKDGLVNFAMEVNRMHTEKGICDNKSIGDMQFIKRVAGWGNPDGSLVKMPDGNWRVLRSRVHGGGQYKMFWHVFGKKTAGNIRPIMAILPTQAQGGKAVPHSWTSVREDMHKEIGYNGAKRTHHDTRQELNKVAGKWDLKGYSLGGTGAENDIFLDAAVSVDGEHKFAKAFIVAPPAVGAETAGAFKLLVDRLNQYNIRIHYHVNGGDLTPHIGECHLGYGVDSSKVKLRITSHSDENGFGTTHPFELPIRRENCFFNARKLWRSLMTGPHGVVANPKKGHQSATISNESHPHLVNNFLHAKKRGWEGDRHRVALRAGERAKLLKRAQKLSPADAPIRGITPHAALRAISAA